MRSTASFLIGAGTAYLLDPQQGKRRRSVVRDRSLRFARRAARVGIGKAKFAGGHLRGLVAFARRLFGRRSVAVDDQTVTQRIRSDAFREAGVSTRDVDVDVDNGVATLRGSLASRTLADDLVAQVRKVPGVRDVAAMLEVSGSAR